MKILNINDIKVAYHYLPSKLTNVQVMVNVGSVAETPEIYGCAHMLEHNFFKGSKKYPGPSDIQTIANDIGGKLNAWTWNDVCSYHITVLNDFFREGFDLLADMYQHPLFPEEEFNKEKNPILSEMRRNEDNPDHFLSSRLYMAMIGNTVGHSIVGTEDTIKSITLEQMKSFKTRFYNSSNTMISIVGGVPEETVISMIKELFGSLASGEKPIAPKVEYSYGELEVKKPGVTEALYTLLYPALPRFHPERYKQSLMTYVLGGNDSGMLFEKIREEMGLSCYGIYASQAHFDTHNILDISTGISPNELDLCHKAVLEQIDRISTTLIDDKRLNRAKAALRTSVAAASENSSGYNNTISLPLIKGETENPLEKLLANVEAVTANDIRDIAQKTFSSKSYLGRLLPDDEAKSNTAQ